MSAQGQHSCVNCQSGHTLHTSLNDQTWGMKSVFSAHKALITLSLIHNSHLPSLFLHHATHTRPPQYLQTHTHTHVRRHAHTPSAGGLSMWHQLFYSSLSDIMFCSPRCEAACAGYLPTPLPTADSRFLFPFSSLLANPFTSAIDKRQKISQTSK